MKRFIFACAAGFLYVALYTPVQGQDETAADSTTFNELLGNALSWRCIGPFRGGRSTTVCGVIQDNQTYYFGSTGGGLWKTTDAGHTWLNVTDGQVATGSVGAVAVAPSDPNVVYLGMGEAPIRGVMTSSGDGVYKSTDAGETWHHIGLEKTLHISQIRVDPANPDIVYVAAQGNPYGPSEDRGVFKSVDGGESWEKIHYVDENSGVSDLSLDPNNSRVLFAAFWDHTREPWYMRSGGEGSGIWKSTDAGTSWEQLTEGLPDSIMGKIGVSVSPADARTVYAIIESEQGGLYRSDDGGRSWALINEDRVLRARSWYYMHIWADPVNAQTVHVLNAPYMKSTDGGQTFRRVMTPHGDNHALWINPNDPLNMINGNDGGGNVSFDAGQTWSTQRNQPTAQFYRVNADKQFPYRVYGGQQDNSSVSVASRTDRGGIAWRDFHPVGGCESAYCAFDPDNPRYVYAGCIQGVITEYDNTTGAQKDIMAYTDLGLGKNPKDMKYRFNWNAPILVSQHNTSVIYHAGNVVLKSTNRGVSWAEISPDLTMNNPDRIDWGGGPITNEGAGGENYHTIMYLSESPHDANELWSGADDGLIQITRDGGATWTNITPPGIEEGIANSIDLSPHNPGTAYVAYTRYKFGDFTPYVYITEDYGATWRESSSGIEDMCHVRCVREDTEVAGLLYAGTERGMFMSWDNGSSWERVQLNLPVVPITDIKVHQGDLVIATQGRAFWILDDIIPLRMRSEVEEAELHVLPGRNAYLWGGPRRENSATLGTNPDFGVVTYVATRDPDTVVSIQFIDGMGNVVRTLSTDAERKSDKLKLQKGLNKIVWQLNRSNLDGVEGLMTFGGTSGTRVGPGDYTIVVKSGDAEIASHSLTVYDDPRNPLDMAAHQEKQALLNELHSTTQDVFDLVKNIRYVREQIGAFNKRVELGSDEELKKMGSDIITTLDSIELSIVQSKQQTFQDVINFPNQIDGQLMHIQSIIDESYPPITQGQKDRVTDIMTNWTEKKSFVQNYIGTVLKDYNDAIARSSIPFIAPEDPSISKKKPPAKS